MHSGKDHLRSLNYASGSESQGMAVARRVFHVWGCVGCVGFSSILQIPLYPPARIHSLAPVSKLQLFVLLHTRQIPCGAHRNHTGIVRSLQQELHNRAQSLTIKKPMNKQQSHVRAALPKILGLKIVETGCRSSLVTPPHPANHQCNFGATGGGWHPCRAFCVGENLTRRVILRLLRALRAVIRVLSNILTYSIYT